MAAQLKRVQDEASRLKLLEERQQPLIKGENFSDEGDPFDLDDEEGRLQMFGRNNLHILSESRAWTRTEMEAFVDGLRELRAKDRYEILAKRLDRSLDEIFNKAKEFKVTMEDRHKQRRLSNPRAYIPPLEDWIQSIK